MPKTKKAILQFQQVIALEALRRIVLKTPVDTGRARGNWQPSINQPIESVVDTTDLSGNQTISNGSATILGLKDFGTIFISNNLPYILKLENGSSQQAANGMVALTLQELQTAL